MSSARARRSSSNRDVPARISNPQCILHSNGGDGTRICVRDTRRTNDSLHAGGVCVLVILLTSTPHQTPATFFPSTPSLLACSTLRVKCARPRPWSSCCLNWFLVTLIESGHGFLPCWCHAFAFPCRLIPALRLR